MASEDVIELGSSDDEAGPAPKKMKPGQNAMVHIPRKLAGVTIKPSKPTKPTKPIGPLIHPGVGKGITISKIASIPNFALNPFHKNKSNGMPMVQLPTIKPILRKELMKAGPRQVKPIVNPVTLINKLNSTQVKINKFPSNAKVLKCPVKVCQKGTLNNLPPSITVTRTTGGPKRPAVSNATNLKKKQKINPSPVAVEVPTVELDDDEVTGPSTASPQWYLRPEEQTEQVELEKKNNAEPTPSNFIEITIEDSPVRPVKNKRTCEVGTELAITIDDSPVKAVTKEGSKERSVSSDNETTTKSKEPSSKKKLDYPKEATVVEINTIEIEIDPIEVTDSHTNSRSVDNQEVGKADDTVIEIQESPAKAVQSQLPGTPKKEENINYHQIPKISEAKSQNIKEIGEFHPVYQNFIDLCFELENSEDMKKIVEKKIKGYYRQVPKEYTESEEFIDMVSGKILSMRAGPEKMYLYIKDIVDELNLQRKMAKSQVLNKETKSTAPEPFLYGEDSEFDSNRQRQIRKLEKTLKKLHRAIQKLENQEVDFDDEDDSVYLLTESDDGSSSHKDRDKPFEKRRSVLLQRYKERMVRVHAKFCQLTNTKMPSEPRVQIDARPGQPAGPAKRLEKWVNKKVPIGTPLPFPDFHDVLRCVREANEEDKLGWNEADIMEEARDLFIRCGKKLQRRRQENEWRLAASRISIDIDPADEDSSLKKKLEENKQLATKKEIEVFNKFADRQSQLKLEAEEIGDKEAEESPVESEDEEPIEEGSTLQNKEKRKERLKRLIQEKSKKAEGKANEPKVQHKIESEALLEVNKSSKETEKGTLSADKKYVAKDSVYVNNDSNGDKIETNDIDKVHSISDGSNNVDSDMDELHLLQKLHTENEVNSSTVDSTDTDTPIDISDTLQSSSDNKGKPTGEVISIENSSYSESETNIDGNNSRDHGLDCESSVLKDVEELVSADVEMEVVSSQSPEKKTIQTNNDEYNDTVENILLASSDEEIETKDDSPPNNDMCVNLKDDAISIGDTVVGVDLKTNSNESEDRNVSEIIPEDNDTDITNADEKSDLVTNKGVTDKVPKADTETQAITPESKDTVNSIKSTAPDHQIEVTNKFLENSAEKFVENYEESNISVEDNAMNIDDMSFLNNIDKHTKEGNKCNEKSGKVDSTEVKNDVMSTSLDDSPENNVIESFSATKSDEIHDVGDPTPALNENSESSCDKLGAVKSSEVMKSAPAKEYSLDKSDEGALRECIQDKFTESTGKEDSLEKSDDTDLSQSTGKEDNFVKSQDTDLGECIKDEIAESTGKKDSLERSDDTDLAELTGKEDNLVQSRETYLDECVQDIIAESTGKEDNLVKSHETDLGERLQGIIAESTGKEDNLVKSQETDSDNCIQNTIAESTGKEDNLVQSRETYLDECVQDIIAESTDKEDNLIKSNETDLGECLQGIIAETTGKEDSLKKSDETDVSECIQNKKNKNVSGSTIDNTVVTTKLSKNIIIEDSVDQSDTFGSILEDLRSELQASEP